MRTAKDQRLSERRVAHFETRQRWRGPATEPQDAGNTVDTVDICERPVGKDRAVFGDAELVLEPELHGMTAARRAVVENRSVGGRRWTRLRSAVHRTARIRRHPDLRQNLRPA